MTSKSSANFESSQFRYSEYDIYARIYNDNIGDRLSQRAIAPLNHLLWEISAQNNDGVMMTSEWVR